MSKGRDPHRGRPGGGRRPTRAELDLWSEYTRDVAPLSQARRHSTGHAAGDGEVQRPASALERGPTESSARATPAARAGPKRPAASAPAPVPGGTAGVDRRTAERLRRGRLPIDARLDLHGMTREAAREALAAFIHGAGDRGLRCVLVITGKGGSGAGSGVLRREVPQWLALPDLRARIVTYIEAQPRHGGGGALYVLLRRRRGD